MKPDVVDQPWPENGLEAVTACPICGDARRCKLYDDLTDNVFFCAPGTWSLHECQGCGSAYLDPRPTRATIYLAYQAYYTHKSPANPATENLHGVRRLQRVLANGYRNLRFGTRDFPASRLGVLAAYLVPGQKASLDRGMRHLPGPGCGRRVLDVGFGNGRFLERARCAGWSASGVDLDPLAVRNARIRGLDVRHGGIEAYADQLVSFDVITMSHVIEHVHDPIDVLKKANALLKPGGRLWLDTPNSQSSGHSLFRRNWRGLEPPRHLTLFTWDAMLKALREIGFHSFCRRIPHEVSHSIYGASERISYGLDPYVHSKIRAATRWHALAARLRSRIFWRSSEFITLVAYKPN